MYKKVLCITIFTLTNIVAQDGFLDSTFGNAGLVITNLGGSDIANASVLQPDGKIVAFGQTDVSGTNDFAVTRYNLDGTLDTSFDGNGVVITDFSSSSDVARAGLVEPNGNLVAVGQSDASGSIDFALARYHFNGSLDFSFGTAGLVTTDFGGGVDVASAALLQPDGKIIAIGRSGSDFALARYNSDGTLDGSFGTGGLVTTDFGGNGDRAFAAVLQPDGKIVAIGQAGSALVDFALARYNPDGTLDSSFGTGGLVTTDIGGTFDVANAALLRPDGKIIAIGQTNESGINEFALAQYNPDGSLDTSFGSGGIVTTDVGTGASIALAALLQPDAKIVALGATGGDFALARYNQNGTLDTSFGSGGTVITDIGGNSDSANAGVLQLDGKIVAVGKSNVSGSNDFALARYLNSSVVVSALAQAIRAKCIIAAQNTVQ